MKGALLGAPFFFTKTPAMIASLSMTVGAQFLIAVLPAPSIVARSLRRKTETMYDEQEVVSQALLRAISSGDQASFASLYDTYSSQLYSMAYRMLNSSEAAAEVVQDTFMAVWKDASRYNAELGKVFTWMVMILRRKAINHMRHDARRLPAGLDGETETDLSSDSESHPDEALQIREKSEFIGNMVNGLPLDQKRALELAFFEGFTHQEIADRLEEPLGTVKSRIRLAINSLRRQMEGGPL